MNGVLALLSMHSTIPNDPHKVASKEEAIELARGDYQTVLAKTIAASISPFLWWEPQIGGELKTRGGTVFYVSATRLFAVTADHVYADYLKAPERVGDEVRCQFGNLRFDPSERLIDRSEALDIATFLITPNEIARVGEGARPMSFDPMVPQEGRGVFFAGFPRVERKRLSRREIETGIFTALTIADNVTERRISGHFDRERQVDKPGLPTAPPGYDIGGVSGAPLITIVDSAYLHYWRLGGVVTQFDRGFEIYYATPANFIALDGTLKITADSK